MTIPPLPRDQFRVAERFCYLDHASVAPPPAVVVEALARDASAASLLGSTSRDRREARADAVRLTCAGLLGVAADDVTLVRNTTEGMALIATGLTWNPGDLVIVADRDHPLTVGPWHSLADLGVEIRSVPADEPTWSVPAERFGQALADAGGRARVLLVSWVNYARGARHDLAALADLAHAHGALLVVDLIQGLGVIPTDLDAWGVDGAVAGGQKWLLGPEGVGILRTTAELRRRLRVTTPRLDMFVADGPRWWPDLALDPSGRRFEGGTRNLGGIGGLGASAELLAGVGVGNVWTHVDAWCDRLVDGLSDLGLTVVSDRSATGRSAVVSACIPGADHDRVAQDLLGRGVVVSSREGAIRFSPHGWNDDDDLAAALSAVEAVRPR